MAHDAKLFPYTATYKDRTPDPGVCLVLAIDWEVGCVEMTNGRCRYFPDLVDVTLAENPDYDPEYDGGDL